MSILSNNKKKFRLNEKEFVEDPFLDELKGLGWQVLRLSRKAPPEQSHRESFDEVILRPQLEEALQRINPFLTPDQLAEVIRRMTTYPSSNLLENNEAILNLLLDGTTVSHNQQTGAKSPTVRYIDFKNPTHNSFIAICQFKLRIPGTKHHIIPDITLFINGLPVVVIECKSPKQNDPIAEAIDQLMRYSQQRGDAPEGNASFFYYNQFLVATSRNNAKFGTLTTHIEKHWYRWVDPYPRTLDDITHGKSSPNYQQRLIAGMCDHNNLLQLIQSFTIFSTDDKGRTIKMVGRYQQFRAVLKSVQRIKNGHNRTQRSGIIWHTQGAGKSLTMMFMVRAMRQDPFFDDWKVVFINDRTQLEEQLTQTSQNIGQTVTVAQNIAHLKKLIATDSPDIIMGMIQKFQGDGELKTLFPTLNESPNILVMIDEAHRTQYQDFGLNLDRAMPKGVVKTR